MNDHDPHSANPPGDHVKPAEVTSTAAPTEGASSSGVRVRAAGLRDLPAIHGLYEELVASQRDPFTELITNPAMVAWTLRRSRQQLLADERWTGAVIEDGAGTLVGYAAALMERQASIYTVEHYGSLSEIYVSAAYRRQELGSRLVAFLLETLAARGIMLVEAHAPASDPGAIAFLESLGFGANQVQLYRHLHPPQA